MSRCGIYYHDSDTARNEAGAGAIQIQRVWKHKEIAPERPYYRLLLGADFVVFMSEDRLRELGRLCLEAEPLPAKSEASA